MLSHVQIALHIENGELRYSVFVYLKLGVLKYATPHPFLHVYMPGV